MAVALFTHGQITTSLPKAKSLRPFVEKLITAAKKGDLASRRRVIRAIGDPILVDRDLKAFSRSDLRDEGYTVNQYHELKDGPRVVKRLFDEIAARYSDRDGGYTRIIKLAKARIGDGTDLCVLQLVGQEQTGPQVSGRSSRRREMANRRMERAAALRRGEPNVTAESAESEAADPESPVPANQPSEPQVADAVEQPPEEEEPKTNTT